MSDYCERPEFYAESFPRSRKPHRCCECHAPIEAGEVHLYARAKWDGYFSTVRQHMLCRELCMLMNDGTDECFAFGDLREAWGSGYWGHRSYKKDPQFKAARVLYARVLRRERAAA